MKVDLNEAEVAIIREALECWEKQAHSDAISSTMFTAMLIRDKELAKAEMKQQVAAADVVGRQRKISCRRRFIRQ